MILNGSGSINRTGQGLHSPTSTAFGGTRWVIPNSQAGLAFLDHCSIMTFRSLYVIRWLDALRGLCVVRTEPVELTDFWQCALSQVPAYGSRVLRFEGLIRQVELWRRATEIRTYVKAVRVALKTGLRRADPAQLEEWTTWALSHADRLDPRRLGFVLSKQVRGSTQGIG